MSKTKLLILGYSSFARRRLIPSLKKMKNIDYYICSKSNQLNFKKKILFNNYNQALNQISPNIVYVSLINSLHYKYAKMSLKKGFNVIVDKPITISLKQVKELIKIARKKNLLISEATLFNYHRVFDKMLNLCGGTKKIIHIQSNFNVPLVKNVNKLLKNKEDCEMDMSPYAASIIRLFTNNKVQNLKVFKKYFNNINVVKSFFLLSKSDNCTYFGNFGIDREYISQITFFTKDKIITSPNRIFALPPKNNQIILKKSFNKTTKIIVKKDDCVKNYINTIINVIKTRNYAKFYNKIIFDSKIRNYIKNI